MAGSEPHTILITGATSGIGLATAELYIEGGHRVIAIGRSREKLNALRRQSDFVRIEEADLSDIAAVDHLIDRLKDEPIRHIILSAGVALAGTIDSISARQWEDHFRINVTSQYQLVRGLTDTLKANAPASIVFISSLAGRHRSRKLSAAYSSSKAALLGLTRHLAQELGPFGVRVNCTCPGPTLTPMVEHAFDNQVRRELANQIPLGRLSTPDEQAKVITFLTSDAASFINGAEIDVNGGMF